VPNWLDIGAVVSAEVQGARRCKIGRQKMARIYIKAIVAVDMPEPKATIEKQSTKERNEQLREYAAERILDALSGAELNPTIQRINLSRTIKEKDSTNE
jgi:hypothetical protein